MAANKPEVRYTTETTLGLDEYKKYVRTMQGSQLKNNIIAVAACIWLIAAGAFNIYNAKTVLGVFMIVVGVGAPILVRVGANNQSERDFEKIREAGGAHFRVRFFGWHDQHQSVRTDTEMAVRDGTSQGCQVGLGKDLRRGLLETVYTDIVIPQTMHFDERKGCHLSFVALIHAATKSKNNGCGCKTVELYSG